MCVITIIFAQLVVIGASSDDNASLAPLQRMLAIAMQVASKKHNISNSNCHPIQVGIIIEPKMYTWIDVYLRAHPQPADIMIPTRKTREKREAIITAIVMKNQKIRNKKLAMVLLKTKKQYKIHSSFLQKIQKLKKFHRYFGAQKNH